jgi:long-chain fatty acid transport protein
MKTIRKPRPIVTSITLLSSFLMAGNSLAAGFYLDEIGTPSSVGTAGVGLVVNSFGADAAWSNPAGMTGIETDHVLGGMQVLIPYIKFDPSSSTTSTGNDGGNAGQVAAIPSFFATKKFSDRLHGGFAVTAPIGGGFDFGDNFAGRYSVIDISLAGVGISSSLGYKVNEQFSIGGGVTAVYTMFEETVAINQAGPNDGKVKLRDLDDWGLQPYAGIMWDVSDTVTFGAVYRAEMDVDLEGDLKFSGLNGPVPPANNVDVSWDNPQTVEVGMRVKVSDDRMLMFNADWEDWSAFSTNALDISGGVINPLLILDRKFQDTWSVGAAMVQKSGDSIYSLGVSYDSSPVEDKDRTIDMPFDETFKVSAAWAWKGENNLDFALGGTLAYLGEGKIENKDTQGVNFDGKFDNNVILFLSGTVKFVY